MESDQLLWDEGSNAFSNRIQVWGSLSSYICDTVNHVVLIFEGWQIFFELRFGRRGKKTPKQSFLRYSMLLSSTLAEMSNLRYKKKTPFNETKSRLSKWASYERKTPKICNRLESTKDTRDKEGNQLKIFLRKKACSLQGSNHAYNFWFNEAAMEITEID